MTIFLIIITNSLWKIWKIKKELQRKYLWDFPGGAVVKNPPANAGDTGSIPALGRSHMPWSN